MKSYNSYPDRIAPPLADRALGPAGLVRAVNVAILAILVLFAAVIIDRMHSNTVLITPISSRLWTICLIGGCALGLTMGALMAVLTWIQNGSKGRSVCAATVSFLFFALMFTPIFALASLRVAWRIAEIAAFAGTTAPTLPAQYREQGYHADNKARRYYAEIDPFHTGDPARVWMPGVDYRKLKSADQQGLAYGFCAKVMEQRAGGAIRIRTNRINDNSPSQLVWCPNRVLGD